MKGKIANAKDMTVYFEEVDIYSTKLLDSIMLKSKGKFRFADKSRTPKFYQLRFKNNQIISLLLEPGEKAIIDADYNDIYGKLRVNGSEGTRLVNQLNRELYIAREKLDTLSVLFDMTKDPVVKDSLAKEYDKVMENHRKFTITFVLTCSNSLASFMALYQQYSEGFFVLNKVKDLQYYKIVTDSLTKYYPRVKQVIALRKNTEQLLNNYQSQKLLSLSKGSEFGLPEIALPDTSDNIISLKSMKGKYILLSFWSTWNDAASDYNLGLKNVYKKFSKKNFEIYQVSFDKSLTSWKKAIKFDELKWINVVDTTFPNSKTAGTYNIESLPANFLIDKDFSTILAKNINPAQLDTKLEKLLK